MTDRVLELLRSRPDLADLAAYPFNFDVNRAYHVEDVHLMSGASLEPVDPNGKLAKHRIRAGYLEHLGSTTNPA